MMIALHRHRAILIPVAVGAVLRIAWALYAARSVPGFLLSGDQYSYWVLGEEIGAGRGYRYPELDIPTAYHPIGFPAILGAIAALRTNTPLPDSSVLSTAALQIALGVASIALVYVVARRTCGRRVAIAAAWIVALFPNLVFAVATYSVELAFIALILGALAIIVSHDWGSGRPPSTARVIAFGVTLALGVLVRPFVLPMLLGVLLACLVARLPWRATLRTVGIPLAIVLLSMVPWTIRNFQTFDTFVPISTNLGDTLCMDRVAGANGTFRWATHEGCADPTIVAHERSRENTKKAIEFVVENPVEEVKLWGMRIFRMMEHDQVALREVESLQDGRFLPEALRSSLGILANAYFFAVGTLALIGIVVVRRGMWRGPERVIAFTTSLFLLIIPMLLWGAPRFHVPLEPFMAIMAAAALVMARNRLGATPQEAPELVDQSTS